MNEKVPIAENIVSNLEHAPTELSDPDGRDDTLTGAQLRALYEILLGRAPEGDQVVDDAFGRARFGDLAGALSVQF